MLNTIFRRAFLLVMFVSGIALAAPTMAQDAPARNQQNVEKRIDARIQALDKRLDLSAEQEAKLRTVFTEHMTAMQQRMEAMRNAEQKPTREERMAQMRQHMQELDKAVAGVLNADQQKKYAEMQSRRADQLRSDARRGQMRPNRGQMHQRRPNVRPQSPMMGRMQPMQNMDRLAKELNLSQAQQDQIRGIMSRNRDEMRKDMNTQMQQRREATQSEIEKVLTPEQREKFRTLRQQRAGRMG